MSFRVEPINISDMRPGMVAKTDDDQEGMIIPAQWGRLRRHVPLAPLTWFRVGGEADFVFEPSSIDSLQKFVRQKPVKGPYFILGAGSNVLVREGGVKGCVIFLPPDCGAISFPTPETIEAGAKVLDKKLAKVACEKGLGGLEFLYTIPGSIGGALRMNAGAFGPEVADVLDCATIMTAEGEIHQINACDMGFSYRHCALPEDVIFLSARFRVFQKPCEEIRALIDDLSDRRRRSQPSGRTGGSTFKNPESHKAWELIDKAGMRGVRLRGAIMSEHHCNFMINEGEAKANDLEDLGEKVKAKVYDTSGILLDWEIVRWGERS